MFYSTIRIIVSLILIIGTARASDPCSALLSQEALDVGLGIGQLQFSSRQDGRIHIKEIEGERRLVARLSYSWAEGESVVIIGDVWVNSPFRRKGLYGALYNQLFLSHPVIKEIRTSFTDTNDTAITEALRNGMTVLQAIKQSPFYKVVSKFGFQLDSSRTDLVNVIATRTP